MNSLNFIGQIINFNFLDQHGGNYSFINEKYYLYFEKFYGNKIFFWDRLNNKKFSSKFNSLKIISEGMKKYDLRVENEICYIMSFNKKYDYQKISSMNILIIIIL